MKVRIAAASGLFVLLALWASAAITLGIVESAAQARMTAEQQDAAHRTANQLAERVQDRRQALVALARRLSPGIAADASALTRILSADPLRASGIRSAFVANAQGAVIAQSIRGSVTFPPLSIEDRDYFREILETGKGVMSRPLQSRASSEPVIVMAEPVLDEAGKVVGLVAATLSLAGTDGLGAIASRVNPTTKTILVDRIWGDVLGHEDARQLLQPAQTLTELRAVMAHLGMRLRGDDLLGASTFESSTIGWAAISGTPWIVFESSDTASLLADMRYTRDVAVGANGVLSVVATLLMLLIVAALFRPLGKLRDRAMRALTAPSDVAAEWPEGASEIGQLASVLRQVLHERSAAEADARQMLGRLQAVMDNSSVGIAFSRDDRFEVVSRSLAHLTGYDARDLQGAPIKILQVSETGWDRLGALIKSTHGRFDVEFAIRRKDRQEVWVRVVGRAIDTASPEAGMVWIVEDATETRRLRDQLSWSATRDPLTELLNRREFEVKLAGHLDDPARPAAALLFLDLDRFKSVNDLGGHAAGDRLLCDIARVIERQVRRSDHVARLGGDEFAILLLGCPAHVAEDIAQRIRCSVRDYRLSLDGMDHSVGTSIGVVHIGAHFAQPGDVLKAADTACYLAKRAGRDTVEVWGSTAPLAPSGGSIAPPATTLNTPPTRISL